MSRIEYRSTRGQGESVSSARAILQGLAPDGGLYVPEAIPSLPVSLEELSGLPYRELACRILGAFLTDFTAQEIRECVYRAYDERFDLPECCALVPCGEVHLLELFHGATIAFKDMALALLPQLVRTAAKKEGVNGEIVILTATSGDTGKAALAGFAGVPGTRIMVFYPKDGVSSIQERQMVTQQGDNTWVGGIRGNFDDAQTGVKEIFNDKALREKMEERGYLFSSANSINIGRLVPQIVYYCYAYGQLLKKGVLAEGQEMNVTVPTGNFGNILAAWYAKIMGLPIGRLICASNENRVLYDFFRTGQYDKNRPFVLTSSPSMDILISSNLERMLYHAAGDDAARCAALMTELKEKGSYRIDERMEERLSCFYGNYCSEEETKTAIRRVFEAEQYVLDPHTAVAWDVCEKYRLETGDGRPMVVASTASPYKFMRSVLSAIAPECLSEDDFAMAGELSRLSGVPVPRAVSELKEAPVRHKNVLETGEMKAAVEKELGLGGGR